jgi:hypothetical protein
MITPPPLIDATPGDPITSENWNNVLAAIRLLVDDANLQRGALTVAVRSNGNPVRSAAVTAVPTGAPARPTRGAVFVGGAVQAHQIEALLPGTYDQIVETEGVSQSSAITMDEDGVSVTIDVGVFAVPNLLGRALSQALSMAGSAGFLVARVIDSHGGDVPPGSVPADTQALPVLAQFPLPGTLASKDVGLFIHVAARSEVIKKVGVPNILGMSVAQAKEVLEDAGLVLGTTKTVTK